MALCLPRTASVNLNKAHLLPLPQALCKLKACKSTRAAFPVRFAETGPITLDTHQRKQNSSKPWERKRRSGLTKSISCFPSQLLFHRENGCHHCVVLALDCRHFSNYPGKYPCSPVPPAEAVSHYVHAGALFCSRHADLKSLRRNQERYFSCFLCSF